MVDGERGGVSPTVAELHADPPDGLTPAAEASGLGLGIHDARGAAADQSQTAPGVGSYTQYGSAAR